MLKRLVAVALQTQQGDTALARNPDVFHQIEKMEPYLVEKAYFLIFSKQFYTKNPEYCAQVWRAIEITRESPEYKKHMQAIP